MTQEISLEEQNTEKDYQIAEHFGITMDEVDSIPLVVVEYLRKRIGNEKKRYAIVNVNLQYEVPENVKSDEQIKEFIENVELPKEYVSDSFEFVKVHKD